MSNFSLGKLLVTRGIAEKALHDVSFYDFVKTSIDRYVLRDWGDLCEDDKKLNDEAVETGESRIHAAYIRPETDEKIWIITEWDRSATTILFPDEY